MAGNGASNRSSVIQSADVDLTQLSSQEDGVLTGPEYDECLDTSSLSQVQWKRSLAKGCLSKNLNDKAKLFSHVRELTRKTNQLPLSSALAPPESEFVASSCPTEPVAIVLSEDVSTPPGETDGAAPLSFTDDELIAFLYSDKWGGSKMQRLVGGSLLLRFLTALYKMEADGMVFTRSTRAYLNHGYWHTSPELIHQELEYAATLEKQTHWIKEKLLVNMAYYSLAAHDPENTLSTVKSKSRTAFRIKSVVANLQVKSPLALKKHPIDKLKLPSAELQSPLSKIIRLQKEYEALRDLKESPDKHPPIGSISKSGKKEEEDSGKIVKSDKGLENLNSDTNIIAEYPILVPEVSTVAKKENDTIMPTHKKKPSPVDRSRDLSARQSIIKSIQELPQSTTETVVMENDVKGESSFCEESDEDAEDINLKAKNEEFTSEVSSPTIKPSALMESVTVMKHLHLHGNEQYVSSLYQERDQNKKSIALRLKQNNKHRQNQRNEQVTCAYNRFLESRPVDLNSRFKSLAAAKELERVKKKVPKLPKEKKEVALCNAKVGRSEYFWSKFYNDQDRMEMEMAVDLDTENAILKRLLNRPRLVPEDTKEDKKGKNKAKNNNYNKCDASNNSKQMGEKNNIEPSRCSMVVARKNDFKRTLDPQSQRVACLNPVQMRKRGYTDNTKSGGPECCLGKSDLALFKKGKGQKHDDISKQKQDQVPRTQPSFSESVRGSVTRTPSLVKNALFDNCLETILNGRGIKKMYRTNIPDLPNLVKMKKGCVPKRFESTLASQGAPKRHRTHRKQKQNRCVQCKKINSQNESNNRVGEVLISLRDLNVNSSPSLVNQPTLNLESESSTRQAAPQAPESKLTLMDKEEGEEHDSTTPENNDVPIQTESELLQQDLARFNAACDCDECSYDDLQDCEGLRPNVCEYPFTYPHKLGCLKKSSCLGNYAKVPAKDHQVESDVAPASSCDQRTMSDECLKEAIADLLYDGILIRKDILVSSLGKTFTTLVFVKERSTCK